MNSIFRTLALGATASVVATAVKSKAEEILQPLSEKIAPPTPAQRTEIGADPAGHPENMPPSELADRAVHAASGTQLTDEQREKASVWLHWVMGVGSGIAYSVVALRFAMVRAGYGLPFGAALFAATHGSSLPAAGMQHPPWELPRAWWMWEGGSHLVYGVTLDGALRVLDRLVPSAA